MEVSLEKPRRTGTTLQNRPLSVLVARLGSAGLFWCGLTTCGRSERHWNAESGPVGIPSGFLGDQSHCWSKGLVVYGVEAVRWGEVWHVFGTNLQDVSILFMFWIVLIECLWRRFRLKVLHGAVVFCSCWFVHKICLPGLKVCFQVRTSFVLIYFWGKLTERVYSPCPQY